MKKMSLIIALLALVLSIALMILLHNIGEDEEKEILSFAGNIQNGGYAIEIDGEYY